MSSHQNYQPNKEKAAGFLSLFKPTNGFFITPILIDLNILIFILMICSGVNFLLPDNESLIKWGANFRPMTLDGQWWRLVTNFFVHIGIIHLLFNMYALLYIGLMLEPLLGKARLLSAYFLTGIVASLTSIYWHENTISAGASGAIFGMYGVFLAMLTTNLIEKSARKALLTSIAVFIGYNLMNGMKGGIDNAAHIGELISGLVLGYAFYPSLKDPGNKKLEYGTIGATSVLFLLTVIGLYQRIPNDIGKYYKEMESFAAMERKALAVYNLPKDTPKDEILSTIKDTGMVYWNKNLELIAESDKLKIPAELHERDQKLIHYCDLRIKCYELMYKEISEDTNKYDDEIKDYYNQIQETIKSLKGK